MLAVVIGSLSTILSTAVIAMVSSMRKQFNAFMDEHKLLMETERNDLKSHIVAIYERAKDRGYITHYEVASVNRLFDSYRKLGGNSYIEAIVHEMNYDMPKVGMPVPSIVAAMDAARKEKK